MGFLDCPPEGPGDLQERTTNHRQHADIVNNDPVNMIAAKLLGFYSLLH